MRRKGILITIFFIAILSNVYGQENELYKLGEDLVSIAQNNNTDKIIDYIDSDFDEDKKAEIMTSFLKTRDIVFAGGDGKDIKLFNVIKTTNYTLIIIQKNNNFILIRTNTNDQFKITDLFTIIKNGLSEKIKNGKKIYKARCYSCHQKNGKGGIGTNLADPYWKYVNSEQDLYDIIANGKKGTMMIAFNNYISQEEINDVVVFLKSLQGKKTTKPKKPEGEKKELLLNLL